MNHKVQEIFVVFADLQFFKEQEMEKEDLPLKSFFFIKKKKNLLYSCIHHKVSVTDLHPKQPSDIQQLNQTRNS